LKLPPPVRDMVIAGDLSAGHARALVTADDPEALAHQIVRRGLSVRQAEALAQKPPEALTARLSRPEKDADSKALEKLLSDELGMTTTVTHKGSGGELRVVYRSLEQLDELCRRLRDRREAATSSVGRSVHPAGDPGG
jgi:ParB family chromosome partitioning protein